MMAMLGQWHIWGARLTSLHPSFDNSHSVKMPNGSRNWFGVHGKNRRNCHRRRRRHRIAKGNAPRRCAQWVRVGWNCATTFQTTARYNSSARFCQEWIAGTHPWDPISNFFHMAGHLQFPTAASSSNFSTYWETRRWVILFAPIIL
jgi:hypothetical protein